MVKHACELQFVYGVGYFRSRNLKGLEDGMELQ
jgi:hypothetical protein